jgi:hypothetical protein
MPVCLSDENVRFTAHQHVLKRKIEGQGPKENQILPQPPINEGWQNKAAKTNEKTGRSSAGAHLTCFQRMPLINTLLQRGVRGTRDTVNRFNGFRAAGIDSGRENR